MKQYDEKAIVKFLRDRLVAAIDEAGESLINDGKVRGNLAAELDGHMATYKNLVFAKTVTLDTLGAMEMKQSR